MDDPSRNEIELDLAQVDYNERSIGSWICCLPCYWLKRNNSFHEVFLSAVTLLVTVLLVASPVLFLISSVPEDKPRKDQTQESECLETKNEKVCLEEQCVTAAKRILASVSWATDPCRDFRRFACGSSDESSETSSVKSTFPKDSFSTSGASQSVGRTIQQLLAAGSIPKPFKKLGAFYKSCIRAGDKRISLLPMFSVLKDLGGYVEPEDQPPRDLTNLIVSLLRLNGAPLFDIYLDSDAYNGSGLKPAPIIDLPFHFGYNWRSWYRNQKDFISKLWHTRFLSSFDTRLNERRKEKRKTVMERILKEFVSGNMSFELKAKEIEEILLFSDMIAEARYKEVNERKSRPMEIRGRTNLEKLQGKYPFVRWQDLLEEFLALRLSDSDGVLVSAPAYMDDLRRILPRFSSRVAHNSLLVIFATDTLYELVNGSSIPDRSTYCTEVTTNAFSRAVSMLYMHHLGEEQQIETAQKVVRVVNGLKKGFEKATEVSPAQTIKETTFQKVQNEDYFNATFIGSLMEDVRVDPENFFENVVRRYRDLRKVLDDGTTTTIPLAVLTQLYFLDELPLYLPYSTVGLVLAREFYGYHLRKMQRELGTKSNPWMVALNREIECIVKQKSSLFWQKLDLLRSKVDFQLDWSLTYSENVADSKGLQLSYEAWKSEKNVESDAKLFDGPLNPRQLFFLNAAQTYCSIFSSADSMYQGASNVHSERVNEVMMNSPDFAEAYNCSADSPMNPRKRCLGS